MLHLWITMLAIHVVLVMIRDTGHKLTRHDYVLAILIDLPLWRVWHRGDLQQLSVWLNLDQMIVITVNLQL